MPFLIKTKIDNRMILLHLKDVEREYDYKITSLALGNDKLNRRIIEKINRL
jgi:hypothetical protein